MKRLNLTFMILAISLFCGSYVHAQECLNGICEGDTVMDSFDRIGIVSEIEDGQIKYRSSGSTRESRPSSLTRATRSNRNITEDKIVLDSFDRVGKVDIVFEDGRVVYTSSGVKRVSRNLAFEISQNSGVQSGAKVIDSFDRIGDARYVFSNGKVNYIAGGVSRISSNVSAEVSVKDDLRSRDRVIDSFDRVGEVQHVFANGKISYSTGNVSRVSRSLVGIDRTGNQTVAEGNIAIDSFDRVATVTDVFRDGRIRYTTNGVVRISRNLSPKVNRRGNIESNIIAIDSFDRVGKVSDVFSDGRIRYSTNGVTRITRTLSPSVQNQGDIKANTIVIDSFDRVGEVQNVFEDGRVQYKTSGVARITRNVSEEVAAPASIDKEKEYSTNNFSIGKPQKFFKDGRMSLDIAGSTRILRGTLYPEVSKYAGIQVGATIVDPYGNIGTVLKIFENGTVRYKVTKSLDRRICEEDRSEEEEVILSAKLVDMDSENKRNEMTSWIFAVRNGIQDKIELDTRVVVEISSYFAFKNEMATEIEEEDLGRLLSRQSKEETLSFLKNERTMCENIDFETEIQDTTSIDNSERGSSESSRETIVAEEESTGSIRD